MPSTPNPSTAATGAPPGRLLSLDAYRGFVMLAMLTNGFGFLEVASQRPDSRVWSFLAAQFNHSAWAGCTFWDLIQPSFMFIVGVAIPFSHAARLARGQSPAAIRRHALLRALALMILGLVGVFVLRELVLGRLPWPLHFQPMHILTQIGITYGLAVLVVDWPAPRQLALALGILLVYWAAFALYPAAPVPAELLARPGYFQGFFAHWNRDANLGTAFDELLRAALGGPARYHPHPDGLQSLNFVSGVASVIFGMLAGRLLLARRPARDTLAILLASGGLCLVAGLTLAQTLTPLVKWLWTSSFALYSTGWSLWLLAAFHWLVDVRGWQRWAFPLVVAGLNPITLFLVDRTADWYIYRGWTVLLGENFFAGTYGPVWQAALSLLALWCLAAFLYWRRIFLRL